MRVPSLRSNIGQSGAIRYPIVLSLKSHLSSQECDCRGVPDQGRLKRTQLVEPRPTWQGRGWVSGGVDGQTVKEDEHMHLTADPTGGMLALEGRKSKRGTGWISSTLQH